LEQRAGSAIQVIHEFHIFRGLVRRRGKTMKTMNKFAMAWLVAAFLGSTVHADQDADKGKSPEKQQATAKAPAAAGKPDTTGKASTTSKATTTKSQAGAPVNHGQMVSDCNHRANERNLKGHERQDYVEWCTSRGYRYTNPQYGARYRDTDRSCYSQANDRGLTGDRRTDFLRSCLGKDDDRVRYDDDCQPGQPRGRDVLGKGCEN
jgi:hypothetical protein